MSSFNVSILCHLSHSSDLLLKYCVRHQPPLCINILISRITAPILTKYGNYVHVAYVGLGDKHYKFHDPLPLEEMT